MIKDLRSAGETVLWLAEKRGDTTRKDIRERLSGVVGTEIQRQKFDQWCDGQTSFPNDIAEIMTQANVLEREEQIELALSLSFTQKTRRLLDG